MDPTILVVDGDEATCHLIQKLLTPHGYAVTTVGDGDAALTVGAGMRPRLAIVEVVLPGRDGLRVMRALRQDDPELPIILMSAVDDVLTRHEEGPDGSNRECIPVLVKPFSLVTLLGLVQQQLPLPNASHPAP